MTSLIERIVGMIAIVIGAFLTAAIAKHINVPTAQITFGHIILAFMPVSIIIGGAILCLKD